MNSHLYRFRSTAALLGEFAELERQEIFFSSLDALNDPMEGYKDIYWTGDVVLWESLLRHYLLCLMQTTALVFVGGRDFESHLLKNVVLQVPSDLPQAPVRELYQNIVRKFIASPPARLFIEAMGSRTESIRRDELRHYIRAFHPLALRIIFDEHRSRDRLAALPDNVLPAESEIAEKLAELFNATLAATFDITSSKAEDLEKLYSASELIAGQHLLAQDFHGAVPRDAEHIDFLMRRFPESYVAALDELTHVPWHVACFSSDPTNASMWAAYADSHKGVCLKFKTSPNGAGKPSLSLRRMNGWRGGADGRGEPVYGDVAHTFQKVTYTTAYPEIDFFNSIGRLPIPALNGFWYRSFEGKQSVRRRAAVDTDAWREEYWRQFEVGATCKTAEWSHENEHRLLLLGAMLDFSTPDSRKLRYNFSDLAGIIFGTRTRTEDKVSIMKIIAEKCRAIGRRDFEFGQMSYSRKERAFFVAPLGLIDTTLGS